MMSRINPLTTPQQRLLQRLMAMHVVADATLQQVWSQIKNSAGNEFVGRDLNDTLSIINRSLKPAFGLEIRSVNMSMVYHNEVDVNECATHDGEGPASAILYHAIVNCAGDDISKATANPEMNPHELALFRLILERCVELSQDADGSGDNNDVMREGGDSDDNDDRRNGSSQKRGQRHGQGNGCQISLSRMDIINLRTELKGAHAGKLSIQDVENALNLFVAQGWLVKGAKTNGVFAAGSHGRNQSHANSGRNRRDSFGASFLQLGPRSYLEFPDFLMQLGMDQTLLPQILIHS